MNAGPSPPSAATIRPWATVSLAGSTLIPSGATLDATTVPSPYAGAMNPSPQGRFPNAPGAPSSPSSEIPGRPSSASSRSVPRGHVTRARVPESSSAATVLDRAAIASKSTAITRASMSSVTPGIVAPRAP